MFAAEADGLSALAGGAAGTLITIPQVLGWGGSGTPGDPGWLLMDFVPRGSPGRHYGRTLGEALSRLHGGSAAPVHADPEPLLFGWPRDNFIGSLPQSNEVTAEWPDFWRDQRLLPQLRMAKDSGYFRGSKALLFEDLLGRMDGILSGAAPEPHLLHGDLWSGNYYPGPDGGPVLIDPATYRGHGEVDLAMMELFGSLPSGFREGYGGRVGLPTEYDAFRRDLYQLYYLLVHVNLFGGGYAGGSLAAARRVLEKT
jgi:fructosamine-3-kinase